MHEFLPDKTASYMTPANRVTGLALQRRHAPGRESAGPTAVPPSVHETLRAPGQPLDPAARATLEPRFGQDFSHVRVHTDARAAQSARSVGALAYTVGRDIVFGENQYRPATGSGQQLLAHELTHTMQQGRQAAPEAGSGLRAVQDRSLEAEADRAGQHAVTPESIRQSSFSSAPAGSLQKWDSPEHVQLGEEAGGVQTGLILLDSHKELKNRTQPVENWPDEWKALYIKGTPEQKRALKDGLTYGEIVALSGDFYASFTELNKASLHEIYDLIPLIRGKASTEDLQKATGGRYLALAEKNEAHFSNLSKGKSNNLETWRSIHHQAILLARSGKEHANEAWAMNASADHFLTDAFSGGHIRTPRSQLSGSKPKNIASKAIHDLENEHGVDVTNKRGDSPWRAYGDDELKTDKNKANLDHAEEAVRLSKQDISDALSRGNDYPAAIPTDGYAAEKIVPFPIRNARINWDPNDAQTELGSLAIHELPGLGTELFTDDNHVRDWVDKNRAALSKQPVDQKIRMINILLDGWVSAKDVDAIRIICDSVKSADEFKKIHDAIYPRTIELNNFAQRVQVRSILSRRVETTPAEVGK